MQSEHAWHFCTVPRKLDIVLCFVRDFFKKVDSDPVPVYEINKWGERRRERGRGEETKERERETENCLVRQVFLWGLLTAWQNHLLGEKLIIRRLDCTVLELEIETLPEAHGTGLKAPDNGGTLRRASLAHWMKTGSWVTTPWSSHVSSASSSL